MRILMLADLGGEGAYHAGDEAMFAANVERLRSLEPEIGILAPSLRPASTAAAHGVTALDWPGLAGTAPEEEAALWQRRFRTAVEEGGTLAEERDRALLEALRSAGALLVSGGGSLNSSWPGHLHLRVALIEAAHRLSLPVVVLGQSLGPHLSGWQGQILARALALADLVALREATSWNLALALGVPRARLRAVPDDALGLRTRAVDLAGLRAGAFISVCLAGQRCREPGLAQQLGEVGRLSGCPIVLVPQCEADQDAELAVETAAEVAKGAPCVALPMLDCREIAWVLSQSALVISARYHGVVFALDHGVPVLGLHNDAYTAAKIGGAAAQAGLEAWGMPTGLAALGGLREAARELWQRREEVASRIREWRTEAAAQQSALWLEIANLLKPGAGPNGQSEPAAGGEAVLVAADPLEALSPWLRYGAALSRDDVARSAERTVLAWMKQEADEYALSLRAAATWGARLRRLVRRPA